jgi:hypothetical protein
MEDGASWIKLCNITKLKMNLDKRREVPNGTYGNGACGIEGTRGIIFVTCKAHKIDNRKGLNLVH